MKLIASSACRTSARAGFSQYPARQETTSFTNIFRLDMVENKTLGVWATRRLRGWSCRHGWMPRVCVGRSFSRTARRRESLGACRTWGVESENWPQRGQFLPDLQAHSPAMGQKDGEKWTAAVDLQPTIPKSDRLLWGSICFGLQPDSQTTWFKMSLPIIVK